MSAILVPAKPRILVPSVPSLERVLRRLNARRWFNFYGAQASSGPAVYSYIQNTLAPVGWWKFNETSGTTATNSGSAGSAANGVITSATLGQTGLLGANTAFSFDGANTKVQVPNVAALANLTTWEVVVLLNATNAGEGSNGALFCYNTAAANNEPRNFFSGSLGVIVARVYNTVPTNFQTATTTGVTASTWTIVFVSYDDAGDRKIHLYKGVSGAVNEYAYSAQPALTGTYKTPTNPLALGNDTGQSLTFNGLLSNIFIMGRTLTGAERTQVVSLSGA